MTDTIVAAIDHSMSLQCLWAPTGSSGGAVSQRSAVNVWCVWTRMEVYASVWQRHNIDPIVCSDT